MDNVYVGILKEKESKDLFSKIFENSEVLQKIIFCKGTIEEGVCDNVKKKISNIAMLNDGDMGSYQIKGLIEGNEQSIVQNTNTDNFENAFTKLSKLYEKREMISKELEFLKNEIETLEQIIQSQLN